MWVIVSTLVLLFGMGYGLNFLFFSYSPLNPKIKEVSFIEIVPGMGRQRLLKQLREQGVIQEEKKFILLGRLLGAWSQVKVGEYQVSPALSPLQVFSIITSGLSVQHPFTIREGTNVYEVGLDLEKKGFGSAQEWLRVCQNSDLIQALGLPPMPSLEGYLYPETYFFTKRTSLSEIARVFVRTFFEHWEKSWDDRLRDLNWSRHQLVILASMIEKETGAAQERPLISAVFHNRLKKGMRLQSDPTTIYGIWQRFQGKIHKSDLLEKTDYNTYMLSNLPLGPISNPGFPSLKAALYPEDSPFLFFVSKNDGTHEFTTNYSDHLQAVKKYQLDPLARAGKSWRDLQQTKKHKTDQSDKPTDL